MKKLEEMCLLDDFLFNKISADENYGKEFAGIILKNVLGREIRVTKLQAQRLYSGNDSDKRGARMDVVVEEDTADVLELKPEEAVIYDIEADNNDKTRDIMVLPKRTRFYHAKMDSDSIKAGAGFDQLHRTYVIMIMSYDPFDRGRLRYTVRRACEEDPTIPYDDGSCTIYLYVHGKPDETDERGSVELQQMLHFMENTDRKHAVTPDLEKIQDMVDHIKQSREAQQEAMKIFEREQMLKEEGREEGRKEERANTEREKKRAEEAEKAAIKATKRAEEAEKAAIEAKAAMREAINEVKRLSAEVKRMQSLLEKMS